MQQGTFCFHSLSVQLPNRTFFQWLTATYSTLPKTSLWEIQEDSSWALQTWTFKCVKKKKKKKQVRKLRLIIFLFYKQFSDAELLCRQKKIHKLS